MHAYQDINVFAQRLLCVLLDSAAQSCARVELGNARHNDVWNTLGLDTAFVETEQLCNYRLTGPAKYLDDGFPGSWSLFCLNI